MITRNSTLQAMADVLDVPVWQAKLVLDSAQSGLEPFVDGVPFIDGRANAKRNKARKYNTVNREAK
jgi:hypothetical protein